MIEIKNVTKVYSNNKIALQTLTLNINEGMFGLIGPNGAGKTTLMRIVATLLRPTEGRVRVYGHDLRTAKGRDATRALLGYLPQEAGLHLGLSVVQELDYMALLKNVTNPSDRKQQVAQVLEWVGLEKAQRQQVKTLSGGMKRRLGIAIALLGNPRLIIVDEPTAGLDPAERVRFRNLLFELAGDRIVVLSTHIIEDVSQICSNLAVISEGRIVFHGTPSGLVSRVTGRVWSVPENEISQAENIAKISSYASENGIVHRVFAMQAPTTSAYAIEPTLEDAYLWIIQQAEG